MAYEDPMFTEENEAKSSLMKFNKIGDAFKGTLVEKKKQKSIYKEDELQSFYKFLVHGGEYHNLDEDGQFIESPIKLEKGTFIGLWGKPQIDDVLLNCKIGQIVGIRLKDKKKSARPGYKPTNVYSIYPGGMDEEYLGQSEGDAPSNPSFMDE